MPSAISAKAKNRLLTWLIIDDQRIFQTKLFEYFEIIRTFRISFSSTYGSVKMKIILFKWIKV